MTSTSIDPGQRFTTAHPCPVCGGGADLPQHQGVRCYGFLSSDGLYAHCTREEHAGALLPHDGGETYAHRLTECRCGVEHGGLALARAPERKRNGAAPRPAANRGPVIAEADYRYVDADGVLVAIHRRRDYADGSKSFAWLTPDGEPSDGTIKPSALPLFGLHDLLAAPPAEPVYFTEGEKACLALRALGLVAVCCGGGAMQREFGAAFAPLKGRRVVVLPDNDSEGRTYMGRVQAVMRSAGAQTVALMLPDLGPHQDIADWIAAGGTRAALEALTAAAWETRQRRAPGPRIESAAELLRREFPPVRMAVPGIIPEGLTVLGGRPKMGKSWLVLGACTAVAAGGRALGKVPVERGDVLLLALEDGPRRIQSRLVQLLNTEETPAGLYVATEWPRLGAGGIEALRAWLDDHPECRMVAIDTLAKFRPRRSSHQQGYAEDYSDADDLQKLAQSRAIAILLVTHTRKAPSDDYVDEISGTLGLSGGADAILVMRRERGRADAVLLGSGRDLEEEVDLALTWDAALTSWCIVGPAAEYRRSAEQHAIVELLKEMGHATPKDMADVLGKPYGSVKFLMWKLAQRGVLVSWNGRYAVAGAGEMQMNANPANSATRNPANPTAQKAGTDGVL